MRSISLVSTLVASLLSLTACGGTPAAAAESTPARSGAHTAGADRGATHGAEHAAAADGCALSPVYFEYDSNTIDARARESLARDAGCLRARPSATVTLVGGTDERGTEEYNFALGERRARAVQGYLTNAGIEAERVRVHSVGEEWASGQDESGMARDRRVEPSTPAGAR